MNIFECFENVPANISAQDWWGENYENIKTALTEISQIQGLPNDFSVVYIKYKEGVGIRVEYENAGSKVNQVNEILRGLENQTNVIDRAEQKYLLSDIKLEGIELTEEYKALLEKERRGEITAEEIEKIVCCPYMIKE